MNESYSNAISARCKVQGGEERLECKLRYYGSYSLRVIFANLEPLRPEGRRFLDYA